MQYRRVSRIAGLVSAVLVTVLTVAAATHAVQTTEMPNALTVPYSLAAGKDGAGITLPVDRPVQVLANQTVSPNVGSTDLTIVNSSTEHELVWNGLESAGGPITSGASGASETHIAFIDDTHLVAIEINSPTSIRVHNGSTSTQKGNVVLIW